MENINQTPEMSLHSEPKTPEQIKREEGYAIYRKIMMERSFEGGVPSSFLAGGREYKVDTISGAVLAYVQSLTKSAHSVHDALVKAHQ